MDLPDPMILQIRQPRKVSKHNHPSMKFEQPQVFSSDCIIDSPGSPAPCSHSKMSVCIFAYFTVKTLPPGATSMDIDDSQMMECNNLCRGHHNNTETGNKREQLASREVIAQCTARVKVMTHMKKKRK